MLFFCLPKYLSPILSFYFTFVSLLASSWTCLVSSFSSPCLSLSFFLLSIRLSHFYRLLPLSTDFQTCICCPRLSTVSPMLQRSLPILAQLTFPVLLCSSKIYFHFLGCRILLWLSPSALNFSFSPSGILIVFLLPDTCTFNCISSFEFWYLVFSLHTIVLLLSG